MKFDCFRVKSVRFNLYYGESKNLFSLQLLSLNLNSTNTCKYTHERFACAEAWTRFNTHSSLQFFCLVGREFVFDFADAGQYRLSLFVGCGIRPFNIHGRTLYTLCSSHSIKIESYSSEENHYPSVDPEAPFILYIMPISYS